MAQMGELNEACVLDNLKQRYQSDLIYSFSGLFLIAVNPYRSLPIYDESIVKMYRGQKRQDRPPHIFSVADGAYQALMTTRRSQSILITGESGAGKTENTKRVIHYLTAISGKNALKEESQLEKQLIQSNPILEAFGNAQTVRNNNSSRFGKFIRIEFDPAGGHITGASIEKYLLEKSRVTHRAASERNFHIFYQLLQGASDELLRELKLMAQNATKRPTAKDFAYTSQSNAVISGVDDAVEFKNLQESLRIVGIDGEECGVYFRVLAAILLLGNLQLSEDEQGQAHIPSSEDGLVADICELLGVDGGPFRSALLNPVIRAGKEIVTQAREKEQVQRSIEALARSLYERLFDKLVSRLNTLLFASNTGRSSGVSSSSSSTFIGVLDIAGFEIFETNSFEQLLINYTNEKLQQFFNHHMFIVEQEEYARQGISWNFVDFGLDSQPMIDLLEKTSPVGILPCLDEDCVLPRANDKSFTAKIQQLWQGSSSKFEIDRLKADKGFILNHYAGRVEYSTAGWVEKNKDPLNENVTRLLASTSQVALLQDLFVDYSDRKTQSSAPHVRAGIFRTVAQKHRESLSLLMIQLASTQPHFVRCILPNEQKQPGLFVDKQVLEQLQCNGVLEGIRICRQGYPNRLTYSDFWRLYSLLGQGTESKGPGSVAKFLEDLMGWRAEEDFALGQEKIFFRAGRLGRLDGMRDAQLAESLRQLQAFCRGAILRAQRDRAAKLAESAKILQGALRPYASIRRNIWSRLIGRVRPLLTVTRSENRIREMKAQMAAVEAEREQQTSQLRQALREERDALSALHTQLAESERARLSLQSSLQERQEALQQLNQKHEALQTDLLVVKASNATLEQEMTRSVSDQKILLAKINDLEAEKASIEDQLKRTQAAIEDQTAQIEKLQRLQQEREGEFEEKLRSWQAEKERLIQNLEAAEEKSEETSVAMLRLQEQSEQALRDYRVQQRSLQASEEKRRLALETEIEDLKRKSTRDLEALRVDLEAEKKSVRSLKEAIKAYETGSSQAEAEKTRSQQAYKREKERLDAKIRDLMRIQEEAFEREEDLVREVKGLQEANRQLKQRIQEMEDQQGDHRQLSKSVEMKLTSLNESIRDLTAERNSLRQQSTDLQYEKEAIEGQMEELQDSLMSLQEQLKCTEMIRSVLEGELGGSRALNARLTAERDALQAELLNKRSSSGNNTNNLDELIGQLERDSLERQGLLRENRRLERELKDTLSALEERDQILLKGQDSVARIDLKARKLQTDLEDAEAQISELERMKRRLLAEVAEEKDRADRLQKDFDRLRSLQRQQQQQNQFSAGSTQGLESSPSLYSIGRDNSCSSIASKLTETTLNE